QILRTTNARLSSDNFWPVDGKCRTFVSFRVRPLRWHYLPNYLEECRKLDAICPRLETGKFIAVGFFRWSWSPKGRVRGVSDGGQSSGTSGSSSIRKPRARSRPSRAVLCRAAAELVWRAFAPLDRVRRRHRNLQEGGRSRP